MKIYNLSTYFVTSKYIQSEEFEISDLLEPDAVRVASPVLRGEGNSDVAFLPGGKKLIKVNPNGTSQTCICGATVKKTLAVRQHNCLDCGYTNHRDIVSAKVILKLGLGHNLRDKTYEVTQSVSLESSSITASV